MEAVTNGKALSNSWLFTRNVDLMVDRYANSIATFLSDEAEQEVVGYYRNRRHRPPVTEWSDLADPFEPASWTDWSPVRSVRLATPATKPAVKRIDRNRLDAGLDLLVANNRTPGQIAKPVRRPRRARGLNVEDIPAMIAELHARMDAC